MGDKVAGRKEDTAERTAVVVLGMHRSGTSALTRVLNLCGAALPQTLMKPGEDNVAGFWESDRVYRITESALQSAGVGWDDVRDFPASWFESDGMSDYRSRLAEAIKEEFGGNGLPVIKDPRLSRLVPLLEGALDDVGMRPRYVIAMRNPLEVAESLRARNGFMPARSILLWLRYVLEAEAFTYGAGRVFVHYDDLLTDWRSVVDRIGKELGISWPGRSTDAEIQVERFLSENLRHHRAGMSDLEGRADVAAQVEAVYEWCRRAAAGEEPARTPLEEARQWLAEADRVFLPIIAGADEAVLEQRQEVDRLQTDRDAHAETLRGVRGERDEQRRAAERLEQERDEQRRIAERLEQERDQLSRDLKRLQADRDEHAQALARVREERDAHQQKITLLEAQRDELEQRVDAVRAKHEQALARLTDELANAREMLEERDRLIAEIRASTSWRATAPIRWLGRRLPGGARLFNRIASRCVRAIFRLAPLPAGTKRRLRERVTKPQ